MQHVRFMGVVCGFIMILGASIGLAAAPQIDVPVSRDGIWTSADARLEARAEDQSLDQWVEPAAFKAFNLDADALFDLLDTAPMEFTPQAAAPAEITLPMPDGTFARFAVVESPVMAPELAAKFPEIRTFAGRGIDDPSATVRFDHTPAGFHAQVRSPAGTVLIDPLLRHDAVLHASYYKRDYPRPADGFECLVTPEAEAQAAAMVPHELDPTRLVGENLRTYRLACAATGEYTVFHGGTVTAGLAAVTTAINRVSGIYESEMAIRMQLVANNNLVIYTNGASDPYTNNNGSAMLTENQSNLNAVIGSGNYDIGHVFSTGGGGIAQLSVVCSSSKARGVTGLGQPAGDPFFVDYVAHEMGHQYGATHTFNGANGSCAGGNRTASTAYEPGSGSTIMAYAGICGLDNLQSNSDPYFHHASLAQIIAFTSSGGGAACDAVSATGNLPPVVSAGPDYTIPRGTPIRLTATGSDPNGDRVTFNWEQRDLGPQAALAVLDQGTIPLFRSWDPTLDPVRTLPRLAELLNNTTPVGEQYANTTRTLHFRCTARDNRGGSAFDDMQAAVSHLTEVFAVTAPNTAVTWASSPQTVTWNVAGTHSTPVNTPNVHIKLSVDGGQTFPITLASSVPNIGASSVTVPALFSNTARVMVEGANNIFFDISNVNFTIAMPVQLSLNGSNAIDDSVGNGNHNLALDPGETSVRVSIGVQNTGGSTATGVSATLVSLTPTVTVVSGASAYPDLASSGGSGINSTPFVLSVAESHVCGAPANLRLSVVSAQGARDLDIVLPTGEGAPMTFVYNSIGGPDPAVSIPDGGAPVNISIPVSGVGLIADVDFRFDGTVCSATAGSTTVGFTHSWVGDINATLISPAGLAVPLTVRPGGGGQGSSGNNFCQTLFNDDGAFPSIQTIPPAGAGAPYTGTWRPAWPLSAFDGQNADGTWTLRVVDTSRSDLGTVRAFSLIITPQVCAPTGVPIEACCFADGSCADLPTKTCRQSGGVVQGAGSECAGDSNGNGIDDLCEEPGACCLTGGTCSFITESECDAQGGQFQGEGAACSPDPCGCPTLTSALSRKCTPSCDLTFEPRQGGISQVVLTYASAPVGVSVPAVESDCTCPSPPAFAPHAAVPSCAVSGNDLVCTFSPPLPAPCTYRLLACSGTGISPVDIRALTGDVNGNGLVDATDRSLVVGAWTGSGYSCATDVNCDGATNAVDRSLVVGAWTSGQNCAP